MTEEVWAGYGVTGERGVCRLWSESDPEEPIDGEVTLVVRVNGKVRFRVSVGVARHEALDLVAGADNARRYLGGSEFHRVVDRFPKLLNLVV